MSPPGSLHSDTSSGESPATSAARGTGCESLSVRQTFITTEKVPAKARGTGSTAAGPVPQARRHPFAPPPLNSPSGVSHPPRHSWLTSPTSLPSLRRAARLVEKYADVPMGFADAGLVVLAEDLDTDLVFTLDRRGFSTYRLGRRRAFRILP